MELICYRKMLIGRNSRCGFSFWVCMFWDSPLDLFSQFESEEVAIDNQVSSISLVVKVMKNSTNVQNETQDLPISWPYSKTWSFSGSSQGKATSSKLPLPWCSCPRLKTWIYPLHLLYSSNQLIWFIFFPKYSDFLYLLVLSLLPTPKTKQSPSLAWIPAQFSHVSLNPGLTPSSPCLQWCDSDLSKM